MPVVSMFCGTAIKKHLRQKEHNPPHFYAIYRDNVGMFSLSGGKMLDGELPQKQELPTKNFIEHYHGQLMGMWETGQYVNLPLIMQFPRI